MIEQRTSERERLPVRVSAAVLICDEEGRLLLVKQAGPHKEHKWSPPSGGMEETDADPIATAIREAGEEIGKIVAITALIGIYTHPRKGGKAIGVAFRGEIVGDCPEVQAVGEISEQRYFYPHEVLELFEQDMIYKAEYNKPVIEDWMKGVSFSLEVFRQFRRVC